MDKIRLLSFLIFTTLVYSCGSNIDKVQKEEQALTLFTALSPESTGIYFNNEVENQKDFNVFKYRNFYNGGGVAIGDLNNDGLADVYMTANMGPNKLYINQGDFKFEEISNKAGVSGNKPWSTGVVMVDINQDGLLDIYVSNAGTPKGNNHDNDLYINNGDLTFTEKAAEYNLAKTGFTTQTSFFDYDKDGDLDAYILNNSSIPVSSLGYAANRHIRAKDWDVPDIFKGVGDLLLRNDNGKFVDVTEEAGIYGSLIGFGLGIYVTDINEDLYPDIYISNDFYERDYLYINNQDGTFSEEIKKWTSHLCLSAMGVDMADINNDGLNDIFITDMLPEEDQRIKSVMEFEGYNVFKLKQSRDFYQQYIQNTLQVNNGNGTFSETAYHSGIAKTDWSWAGLLFDMDNDGYKDLYITNGINHDLTDIDFVNFFADEVVQKLVVTGEKEDVLSIIEKMPIKAIPNYAYHNQKDLTFEDATKKWGLEIPSFSNGCAYADLDNDGDLDLVVNNANMKAFVFKNNSEKLTKNNYLKLKFKGSEKNSFGIGTSLNLYLGDQVIHQELMPSRGFQSSMDYDMTIGLGKVTEVDSIRVLWPDDQTQVLKKIKVNQTLTLAHQDALEVFKPIDNQVIETLVDELPNDQLIAHKENLFNDFDQEGLIAKQLSQEGPSLAIADVNGDGNEDVYVGGAKNQSGKLYLHQGKGILKLKVQNSFESDATYEDTAATFLDADGDGDQDLMVGAGGNEIRDQKSYGIRLYMNDGNGNFVKVNDNLPSTRHNVAVLAANDVDGDGDIDLFVGSRSVPGVYGINPKHLLLLNNGDGIFNDATERFAYDTKDAGMITDAKWEDLDGDGRKDLITVSEWGTPNVYTTSKRGRISKMESDLDSFFGWWNVLELADLDKDGDLDLIFGNQGSNIPYKASKENPVKMWINDFDNNGTIEQVTTVNYAGGDYPVHMKKEITSQMVSLRKQNLKAAEYSKKTVDQIFSKEIIDKTIVKKVDISESVIAINEGNGKFTIKTLPNRVQLSCVCGITCTDVNQDGNLDLIMAGNNFEFKPQYSRLDASYGNVLLGDGNLNFEWQNYNESGFFIRDEVKHINTLKDKNGDSYLFVAINDQKPKIYQLK